MSKKKKELPKEDDLESMASGLRGAIEDNASLPPPWFLHTGNLALDYIISQRVDGTGGWPCGTSELFGDPASGKSLLLAKAISEMQKVGGVTILADAEMRWDDDFAALQGVDDNKLLKFYPETVEEFAVEMMKFLTLLEEKEQRALFVLDSLGILSTLKEVEDLEEGEGIKADQGRKAQKMKAAIRGLKGKIRKTGSVWLVSNHVIANPGAYGNARMTPGGQGVPFQANVRVELLKPTQLTIKGKERPIGVEIRARVTKNSVAPPFGESSMSLYWASGVSKYSGLLDVAIDLGIIERRGAWNYYKETAFQSGDFEKIIQENPAILEDESWKNPYWLQR